MALEPIEIKKIDKDKLQIIWIDGFASTIRLKDLRDNCPCAQCQGEQIGFKKIEPLKIEVLTPEKYDLKAIEPVGNYAIQIIWKDGHDTGIYSFDFLRKLMEEFSVD
ncbi:MAG: DUF971 domain-containing protein [Ignavibacteria bacterium]|nr:DUF971 domain-containing protein [Ignavibacteria bacterium]